MGGHLQRLRSNDKGIMSNEIQGAGDSALCNDVIEGLNRIEANKECVRYLQGKYDIWQNI